MSSSRRLTHAARPFLLFLFLLLVSHASFAQTSTCISCHTDDAILKSLYQPPKIEAGEGEG